MMFNRMTRFQIIQTWFATVAIVAAIALNFGGAPTLFTSATLLALSFVPPAILLILWRGVQPSPVAEVIDRRQQMRR